RLWSHDVVVADEQQAMVGVRLVVVVAEAEAVAGIQPAGASSKARISAADIDVWRGSVTGGDHVVRSPRLNHMMPGIYSSSSRFIGREDVLRRALATLQPPAPRLLTLTGPGFADERSPFVVARTADSRREMASLEALLA